MPPICESLKLQISHAKLHPVNKKIHLPLSTQVKEQDIQARSQRAQRISLNSMLFKVQQINICMQNRHKHKLRFYLFIYLCNIKLYTYINI